MTIRNTLTEIYPDGQFMGTRQLDEVRSEPWNARLLREQQPHGRGRVHLGYRRQPVRHH